MFGLKSGNGAGSGKAPLVFFDVRIDSPYKDLVLISGSPLESNPVPLTGRLVFSLSQDIVVKKVSLKLTGKFKLDFLQMGRDKKRTGVASIVKDQKTVLETRWENLLVSSQGKTVIGDEQGYETQLGHREIAKRSLSSPVVNRLKKKTSNHVLELPANGISGTPYKDLYSSSSYVFHLPKGNYELPFTVMLPSDVQETVEGLQSGSILYNFEAHIDRKKKPSSVTSLIKEDLEALHHHHHSFSTFTTYKYLRIFRTLSMDNMALQQEMSVSGTCTDKIQYEVSLPSKAIAIGGSTPIQINLFPFRKGYVLDRVNASLIQFYAMRDNAGQHYDDQLVITKQTMTEFGEAIDNSDKLLTDKTQINSIFQMPDNLKKITQDCDLRGDLIQVRHKLAIKIVLRIQNEENDKKTLEIKANLPVLLYISAQTNMKGRLVLFDNANGNIHFRTGELVPLFGTESTNSSPTTLTTGSTSSNTQTMTIPNGNAPPNYQERFKDCLIRADDDDDDDDRDRLTFAIHSAPVSPTLTRAHTLSYTDTETDYFNSDLEVAVVVVDAQVPSYEQSMPNATSQEELPPPI